MSSTAPTVPAAVGGKGLRSGVIGLTGSMVIAASSVAPAYSLAAALAGTLIPLGLQKIGVDPAVSSTVFLTTVTDVIGFLAFLVVVGSAF